MKEVLLLSSHKGDWYYSFPRSSRRWTVTPIGLSHKSIIQFFFWFLVWDFHEYMLKRETKSMHLETPQLPSEIKPGEVFIHLLKYLSTPLQQLLEYLLKRKLLDCVILLKMTSFRTSKLVKAYAGIFHVWHITDEVITLSDSWPAYFDFFS